ncbi:PLD nuclease N-terminal domain-containing protein [Neobacillus sp. YIM B06451]|uniref:PLD nuclease N-terminal domain-containing protein n=1 Tax=Neobacillus sp. YIM B06451 TaxID=3070994 RepID=UPI00292D0AD1|nr:PLD nuclease N-terminal domain-containing protein [Neobacillus sp. YIM B06451]
MDVGGIGLGILLPIMLIQLVLLVIAIVDLIRTEETNGPKWVWALVILVFSFIGPIVYFIFGRRNT